MGEPHVQYSPVKRTYGSLSLKKKLSTVLSSCRICLSCVFEPARLTICGHSFCEKCLDTYWQVNNKPNLIVCPLCRGQASDISFVLKEDPSTKALRKTFDKVNSHKSLCLKMMLIPVLYWIVNWLQAPVMQLLTNFQMTKLY